MINEIHVETWGCFIKCVRIGENPPWYIKCVPSTINEYLPKKDIRNNFCIFCEINRTKNIPLVEDNKKLI